ncbi:hypothetical protein VCRA2114E365_150038 [Vibrio crassostreae]|nr:hypothetical protein EDB30_102490 [Vibrio crassostreae]TCT50224.1 hypothetical protein EDB42_10847 [Vibrio crassostreae]TCT63159.1 hypothetical protein EDB31_1326 [Vibrio crassostreae]TCT75328.1 hypothetical protein EDB41_108111 [Vibrio crassostreae]TCT94247.1 hypothetical protein EDB38_10947 [Vibrio crassostreae]
MESNSMNKSACDIYVWLHVNDMRFNVIFPIVHIGLSGSLEGIYLCFLVVGVAFL